MATSTTNYSFVKPAGTENYDVDIQNANWDDVDATLKGVENLISAYTVTNMTMKTNFAAFGAPYGTPRFILSADGKRVDVEGAFKRSAGGSLVVAANVLTAVADVPTALVPTSDKQWKVTTTVAGQTRTADIHLDFSAKTLDIVFPAAATMAVNDFVSLEGIGWWL